MQGRNRNGPKWGLVPQAAQLPASKKASKNNGQNFTLCCKLSSYRISPKKKGRAS
jgi:hypothetical protein